MNELPLTDEIVHVLRWSDETERGGFYLFESYADMVHYREVNESMPADFPPEFLEYLGEHACTYFPKRKGV